VIDLLFLLAEIAAAIAIALRLAALFREW